jgi:mRNA interferase HicA
MKSSELKRWLKEQGATFGKFEGSHMKVYLNGRQSILPMHHKEIGKGMVEDI